MVTNLVKVGLQQIRFVAHIGLFPEEKILKNVFIVDFDVSFNQTGENLPDKLLNTIDYVSLYEIVKQAFSLESDLIESIAEIIIKTTKSKYPYLLNIHLKIAKQHPPIEGEIGSSFVESSVNF